MDSVDREVRQKLEAAGGDAGDADRDPAHVADGVAQRDLCRKDAPHVGGGQAPLRDEQHRAQPIGCIEPDRFHALAKVGGDDEATQQRGRGVVGVALDRGCQLELLADGEPLATKQVPGEHPANAGRGGGAHPARQRDPVVHRDAPADGGRTRSDRRLERCLEARHEAVRADRRQLPLALAVTASSIAPSASTASTLTRLHTSRAMPRQSYPAPRFAVDAGTSTMRRRPTRPAQAASSKGAGGSGGGFAIGTLPRGFTTSRAPC